MTTQLSREALVIYLRNLRTLEYIKNRCNKSIQDMNTKEKQIESEIVRMKNTEFRSPYKPDSLIESILGFLIILAIITGAVEIFADIILGIVNFFGEKLDDEAVVIAVTGIIVISINHKKEKSNYTYQENQVKNNIRQNNDNISKTEEKLNSFRIEKQKYTQKINRYIDKIDNMLKECYNLNIVPKQFRDIYGVTYLYDFVSTSNLSLSDAVMNCNMEQIKSKLDCYNKQMR